VTNLHRYKKRESFNSTFIVVDDVSLTKGAATKPRVSCGLQPCDYHKERAGYLGLWKMTHHNFVPYSLIAFPFFLTNSMGAIKHTDYAP
jgi:hypothetical protein